MQVDQGQGHQVIKDKRHRQRHRHKDNDRWMIFKLVKNKVIKEKDTKTMTGHWYVGMHM